MRAIIQAAAKYKSVKRVVYTSSVVATAGSNARIPKEGVVYDDKSFNKYDTVETMAYCASKVGQKAGFGYSCSSQIRYDKLKTLAWGLNV